MGEKQGKRSKEERRRYSQRRSDRTAASAEKSGTRWTIGDARLALDLSLTVTQAAVEVGKQSVALRQPRAQSSGDGLDGGKRVADLVAEHADEPSPGQPLLFAQGRAHVGEKEQRVGHSILAEAAAPDHPA